MKELLLVFLFLLIGLTNNGQRSISGYIIDESTGEALVGATIWNSTDKRGASANNQGLFQMNSAVGDKIIVVKYVGYNTRELNIYVKNDTIINVKLTTNNLIDEVVVSENHKQDFLLSPAMSMHRIQGSEIKKIPSILGEPDIIKAIQMLPGVSMTNEGKAAVSVRGGSPDQTLMLLDGVPVYNVSHLFGYLSTFNPDVINSASLYKGGVPSRYGGRLSSVLDITSKEGNLYNKTRTLSVGTLSGRFHIEGPIKEDKISYSLAGRRTWLDLPMKAFQKIGAGQELSYGFWDINGKLNWKLNQKNTLFISFYNSKDIYKYSQANTFNPNSVLDYQFNWQNQTKVLRWNHIFNSRLFANTSIYNSKYTQEQKSLTDKKGKYYDRSYNSLNDWTMKSDFFYAPSAKHQIKFGYQLSTQSFSPEIIEIKQKDTTMYFNKDIYINNTTIELYAEDEMIIFDFMKLNYGLRGSSYFVNSKQYNSLEPRVSSSFHLLPSFTVKASYSRMTQFLHMLTSHSIGIPVDMWVGSTENISPGKSNLYSLGFYYKESNSLQFSTELYYSEMKNVLRYTEGVNYYKMAGYTWEKYVTNGSGSAYGAEFFAEKTGGRITGWASYCLSWSNRVFPNINFGRPFPYDYDRRHQLKLFGSYMLEEKIKNEKKISRSISGNFVLMSGNYVTFSTQEYAPVKLPLNAPSYYDIPVLYYHGVNNLKMPAYHRLDLTYQVKTEKNMKEYIWDFGIYNLYNRKNVFAYYKHEGKIKQVSFFPFLPSVTFTYRY